MLRDRTVAARMTAPTSAQQVNWWLVHEYVAPLLTSVGSWPTAGTPEWCELEDTDPRKLAALFDSARHHALRQDTAQAALAEASHAIAGAADWTEIAHEVLQRREFYGARPWLRRSAGAA